MYRRYIETIPEKMKTGFFFTFPGYRGRESIKNHFITQKKMFRARKAELTLPAGRERKQTKMFSAINSDLFSLSPHKVFIVSGRLVCLTTPKRRSGIERGREKKVQKKCRAIDHLILYLCFGPILASYRFQRLFPPTQEEKRD